MTFKASHLPVSSYGTLTLSLTSKSYSLNGLTKDTWDKRCVLPVSIAALFCYLPFV